MENDNVTRRVHRRKPNMLRCPACGKLFNSVTNHHICEELEELENEKPKPKRKKRKKKG